MSAIETVKEYRGMGDSWPKAIGETIALRQRIGWKIWDFGEVIGQAICGVGDKLTGGGTCRHP